MAKVQIKEKQPESKMQAVAADDFAQLQTSSYPNGHAQKVYLLKDKEDALNVPITCMFLFASQWTKHKIYGTPEASYVYMVTTEDTVAYPKGTLLCERIQHPKFVDEKISTFAHRALLGVTSAINPEAVKGGVVVPREVQRVFSDSTLCGRTLKITYSESTSKKGVLYKEIKYESVGEETNQDVIESLIQAGGFEFPAGHFDDQNSI